MGKKRKNNGETRKGSFKRSAYNVWKWLTKGRKQKNKRKQ